MTKTKVVLFDYDKARKLGMLQGMCICIAAAIRQGYDTFAREQISTAGITREEIKVAGCAIAEYNAKPILAFMWKHRAYFNRN